MASAGPYPTGQHPGDPAPVSGKTPHGTWFIVGGTTALVTIGFLYLVTSSLSSLINAGYTLANQTGHKKDNTGLTIATIVVGAGTVVPAVHLKGTFSRGREKALMRAYELGKPLPAEIRSALQDQFFRRKR